LRARQEEKQVQDLQGQEGCQAEGEGGTGENVWGRHGAPAYTDGVTISDNGDTGDDDASGS